jgi:hypothetical protein
MHVICTLSMDILHGRLNSYTSRTKKCSTTCRLLVFEEENKWNAIISEALTKIKGVERERICTKGLGCVKLPLRSPEG